MKSELRSFFNSQMGADVLGFILLIPGAMIAYGLLMMILTNSAVAFIWLGLIVEGVVILADIILFLRWLQDNRFGRGGGRQRRSAERPTLLCVR